MAEQTTKEEIEVIGKDLWKKIKEIVHEGNIRKIVIKKSNGDVFLTVPVTVGVIGALVAPLLFALGAVGAMTDLYIIELTRVKKKAKTKAKAAPRRKIATRKSKKS